jgi:hypothetical protein
MDKKFSGTIACDANSDIAEVLEDAYTDGHSLLISSKSAKLVNGEFNVTSFCLDYNDLTSKRTASFWIRCSR